MANTPVIQLTVGGPQVQVNLQVFSGPGGTVLDTTSTLVVNASNQPAKATIAAHSTNPRAVILTPGTEEGGGSALVQTSPTADDPLSVVFQTSLPPNLRKVVFVDSGPVT
jgi:hypothetical protein